MKNRDEAYMSRCLELARGGLGYAAPNPMVGCVIVHHDRIIGEGFHRQSGEAHAEVNAIASVADHSLLPASTLYVNLEPCAHHGKTPPCADLLIQKGIPRVVVGCLDPFPAVSGKGIARLQEAGVEVTVGLLEAECRTLNKVFLTFHEKRRPYIILKWAQSADGYIDRLRTDATQPPVQFSTVQTRRTVHKLRAEAAAIMVGSQTALLDNPTLSVRHWAGRSPIRIVLDRQLRIPAHHRLLDGSLPTLVFTARQVTSRPNVEYITLDSALPPLPQVLNHLYDRKLTSLLVEGGSRLLSAFLQAGLYDEVRIEKAPFTLGQGVAAPDYPVNRLPLQPSAC